MTGSQDFLAFQDTLRGAFDLAATAAEAADFAGSARWSATRGFALATLEASPARLLPARSGPPDAGLVAQVGAGEIDLNVEGAPRRLAAGSVVFLALGEPFELRFPAPACVTMLAANRASFAERFVVQSLWHGLALAGEAMSARVFGGALDRFSRYAGQSPPGEAEALASGLFDLAARAANAALRDPGASPAADGLATFIQIRRFVDANLGSIKLDTAMIARAFGLSHATLYRLFAPLGGVAAYIRKARLARARRMIASVQMADRRIADIAHASGFRSPTVFNRLFLSEFGSTPSEARAQALRDHGATRRWTSEGEGDLAQRLRELS